MLEIGAKSFLYAIHLLTFIEEQAKNGGGNIPQNKISKFTKSLEELQEYCDYLNANLSYKDAYRAVRTLKRGKTDYQSLARYANDIRRRLADELELAKLYVIQPTYEKYYRSASDLFGIGVATAFPDAVSDMEEAGRCLAVSRATASVFHLMRAMEKAVQKIGDKLGANIKDKHGEFLTWAVMLANIDNEIKKLEKREEAEKWSSIRAQLYHVNKATRTPTMHPKKHYTSEQAMEVLDAAKPFFRDLAPLVE